MLPKSDFLAHVFTDMRTDEILAYEDVVIKAATAVLTTRGLDANEQRAERKRIIAEELAELEKEKTAVDAVIAQEQPAPAAQEPVAPNPPSAPEVGKSKNKEGKGT